MPLVQCSVKHMAQKVRRTEVLQSGIHIAKRIQENEDTERSSHPKMNSSNENNEKVWNLVMQTRQDSHQAYYVEICSYVKLCTEKGLNSDPKICSSILKMHQLNMHSLSKAFMAKYLLMDLKTSLFMKFGPH